MTIFATDNLAVASGVNIQAEDANWVKNSAGNGGNIIGNTDGTRSRQSTSTTGYYYYNVAPPHANYSVKVTVLARASIGSTSRVGVLGRFSDSALSGYRFQASSVDNKWSLHRLDAGAATLLDSADHTFTVSTTYEMELRMVGTTIEGWVDGVKVVEAVDAVYTAAGYAGLVTLHSVSISNTSGFHFQNFEGDSIEEVSFSGTVPTLNGTNGVAFSQNLSDYFSGGTTPYNFTLQSGSWPAGLSIDADTGVIYGTPSATGTTSGLVVRCTDAGSNFDDTNSFSIVIAASNATPTFPGPNIANDATLVEGTALTPLDVSSKFSDPGDTLTFSKQGTWPPGVDISSSGVISGTPTTLGTYNTMKVRATDTASQHIDSNTFTYTVAEAPDPGTFGTISARPCVNNTNTPILNTECRVWIYNVSTGALVYTDTVETDEDGIWSITDISLAVSTNYRCVTRVIATGAEGMETYMTGD